MIYLVEKDDINVWADTLPEAEAIAKEILGAEIIPYNDEADEEIVDG